VQIDAATAHTVKGLVIAIHSPNTGNMHTLDVGVGAAASEVVIIPDLPWVPYLIAGTDRNSLPSGV